MAVPGASGRRCLALQALEHSASSAEASWGTRAAALARPEQCRCFLFTPQAYVLSFSLIMLNTDLHSPQVCRACVVCVRACAFDTRPALDLHLFIGIIMLGQS